MTLRTWQAANVAAALEAAATPGVRRLWVAPTGTGKGTAQLAVLEALRAAGRSAVLTTPSGEIARGMLDRLGVFATGDEVAEPALWRAAEAAGIYSPVRLRNRLAAGRVARPDCLLVDECHHVTAASTAVWARLVDAMGDAPILGWTATPYRGTHRETQALRAWWGAPEVLLSIADAADAGWLAVPEPTTWGLLDDRAVRVRGGEYDEDSAAQAADEQGVPEALAARLRAEGWYAPGLDGVSRWARPTLIAGPGVAWCGALADSLTEAGFPARLVSGETPRAERDRLLAGCRMQAWALVQVQVLAEGVDMPWLRRLIDLRPLRSPVAWMQLVGRITRPTSDGEPCPEYVAGCRNLERHGYLWKGRWPSRKIAEASQAAFAAKRPAEDDDEVGGEALDRGVAHDALSRKRRVAIPLLGGGVGRAVILAHDVGWDEEEHVLALAVPGEEEPRVYARRVGRAEPGEPWTFGRWAKAELDAAGYRGYTRPPKAERPLSEAMRAWWARDAARVGLDPDAADDLTRAQFAVLPALCYAGDSLLAGQAEVEARGQAEVIEARGQAEVIEARGQAEVIEARAPRAVEATWSRLPEGTWGARVSGEAARDVLPGDTARLTSRDGRVAERPIVALEDSGEDSGEGWARARIAGDGAQGDADEVDARVALGQATTERPASVVRYCTGPGCADRLRDADGDLCARCALRLAARPEHEATFTRVGPQRKWGARIVGPAAVRVAVRDRLVVRTRDGRAERKEVRAIVGRGPDWALVEF